MDSIDPVENVEDRLQQRFLRCIRSKRDVKALLQAKADDLEKHLKNAKIVKLTGAPLGVIGAGLTIAGFISGFFTFGVGFSLCIAGAAVAGSAGVLGASGAITEVVATKCILSNAKRLLDEDRDATERLEKELRDIYSIASAAGRTVGVVVSGAGVISQALKLSGVGLSMVDDVATTAFRSLSYAGRAFQSIGFAFTIVFLPFDIYTIVTNSRAIHKNEIPEKVTYLRGIAEQIVVPDEEEFMERFRRLRAA